MANRRTRIKYNPRTKALPGTNTAVLARALQLIARREARLREQPQPQPCGLSFSSSTNVWLHSGTTSSASSTTSKENTSSKSSYSSRTSNSPTPAPAINEAPRTKKRKTSPSIYQQELARKKHERLQRSTPQASTVTSTTTATPTALRFPAPTASTMNITNALKAKNASFRTKERHDAYHGTTHPEDELELPMIQARRRLSSVDDEPRHYSADLHQPSTPELKDALAEVEVQVPAKRLKANNCKAVSVLPKTPPKDNAPKIPIPKSFGPIVLTPAQLANEKQNCHYCQLEAFSTHTDYPVTIENNIDDGATLPNDFRFIEKPSFGTGVSRCDPDFRAGCECKDAKECVGYDCSCHDPDDDHRIIPYHTTGPKKGCLKKSFFHSAQAIFECHDACLNCMTNDCPKRVVDRGRKIPLTIFRTPDGRGWGVRSTVDIQAGQFVDKYIGEILTPQAANHRRDKADRAEGKDIYLFALDKFEAEELPGGEERPILEVDGEFFGGPTRFINHCCVPNLRIFARVGDESDKHIHDLAFFAIRDIKAGTELNFDYVDGQDVTDPFEGLNEKEIAKLQKDMAPCLCGAAGCRKWLW